MLLDDSCNFCNFASTCCNLCNLSRDCCILLWTLQSSYLLSYTSCRSAISCNFCNLLSTCCNLCNILRNCCILPFTLVFKLYRLTSILCCLVIYCNFCNLPRNCLNLYNSLRNCCVLPSNCFKLSPSACGLPIWLWLLYDYLNLAVLAVVFKSKSFCVNKPRVKTWTFCQFFALNC